MAVFGFLLSRVFQKLDDLEDNKASRKSMEKIESVTARKDHCELVARTFEDKFAVVHKRIDNGHQANKEDHERLEKLLGGMGENIDKIAVCVTKLSASVKC